MTHVVYLINKIRFGQDGKWNDWEYEAESSTPNYTLAANPEIGVSGRHTSLDKLALELAVFPGIDMAEFIKGYREHGEKVSLCSGKLSQYGRINDEELGELGASVQRYSKKPIPVSPD